MENASKALLIAAAVLIVILLIAFGMKVMNSTGNSTDQGAQLGEALKTQTETAGDDAKKAMGYEQKTVDGKTKWYVKGTATLAPWETDK